MGVSQIGEVDGKLVLIDLSTPSWEFPLYRVEWLLLSALHI